MKYKNILKGKFISRPNRFIAHIEINNVIEICHVKNTGRCKELLIPNATVFVEQNDNPKRRTKFSLIGVIKEDRMINMDSQVPNKVVQEWISKGNLFEGITLIKPETKYKNSRFDFYVETEFKKAFIEVKGVTLEEKGIVRFPDAPTERV
jgi:sugar fermentation stimulation protein A